MILQALKEYYDRKAADPEGGIAPLGFEWKALPFLVVIKSNGEFLQLEDTTETEAKRFLVPKSKSRSGSRSFETTFLLWDHIGYVFGEPKDDPKSEKQHSTWKAMLQSLPPEIGLNSRVEAIRSFYEQDYLEAVKNDPLWAKCSKLLSCNMAFKIAGDLHPVPCLPFVQEYVRQHPFGDENPSGFDQPHDGNTVISQCLVTGEVGAIARTISDTPINKDSKKLISFQKNSGYDSYGKEQGYNAPIGIGAAFAFTEALNHLLRKGSTQRMTVGDATTVFWSSRSSEFESNFKSFFNDPDNPDRGTMTVADLFSAVENGTYAISDAKAKFYVLGLAPNAARISIRFWIMGTVSEMAGRIKLYFEDLEIVHRPSEKKYLPIWLLLASTALKGKSENIPPNLAGDTMRAILEGLPFPATLLQSAVRRFRISPDPKIPDPTYPLAALLKASLNRSQRTNPNSEKPILPMLDPENKNIGYRLGRLFAALEKIQGEAQKSLNATIRDRFYGAASSTPVTVFGNLMRLKNHHLSKLTPGRRINMEKLLGEITDGISDFPAHLVIADQARFALGYYHQMQAFYTTKAE